MELVPKKLHQWAEERQAGVLLTDYYLARRKRIHLAYIPETHKQFESVDLDECMRWLVAEGCEKALFVGAQTDDPAAHYISRIRQLDSRDFQ